jgi:hypothetical protein
MMAANDRTFALGVRKEGDGSVGDRQHADHQTDSAGVE